MTDVGDIILLNGASSSGKSTLAAGLQAALSKPFWHISIDHFVTAKMLPMARIESGDFQWRDMREQFFEGFHRSLAALALAGNHLIVEHIVESEDWMLRLLDLLGGFDVFFVGLHCPLAELERREAGRGDRRVGEAKNDFETTHTFCHYDLEIDSNLPVELNVARVIEAFETSDSRNAFDKMRELRRQF